MKQNKRGAKMNKAMFSKVFLKNKQEDDYGCKKYVIKSELDQIVYDTDNYNEALIALEVAERMFDISQEQIALLNNLALEAGLKVNRVMDYYELKFMDDVEYKGSLVECVAYLQFRTGIKSCKIIDNN